MFKKPHVRVAAAAFLVLGLLVSVAILRSAAQQPSGRITRAIDNGARLTLAGSRSPRTRVASDLGPMAAGTKLRGITLSFSRSAAQEVTLQKLIAEQQNPESPLYHKWLTPDEFGARFGLAASDLAKVQAWLQQQGFTIDRIARSRNNIRFSGTVAQVENSFGTEMHNYRVGNENHFAPARDLTIPAALSPVVLGVGNLTTLSRPRPHLRKPTANFTSSQTGNHFLTPKDVATIYSITNPEINQGASGPNGAGQSIAIIGQSSVALSDIENFQNALGIPVKDPTLVLVPSTGDVEESSGDEAESDLDLEYSSSIATGATVYFVYVGNDDNSSVWDSLQYAVDTQIAPIISSSYGICETALVSGEYATINSWLSQAAAQGQTVISAAGDTGSTDCSGTTGLTTTQQEALAVDFPGSSQYVTSMGGSEFPVADVCSPASCTTSAPYWQAANGSDVISSATQYMLNEQAWNDDSSTELSSGGGGISTLTATPSWQNTSVPGMTTTPASRMVPDISLSGSNTNAPYLLCSSDTGFTSVTGSCANGFRASDGQSLTAAGGTSFDAPIFAGLVALINEEENATGQGTVNPTLYSLASNSGTYGSAFHDITHGGNQCTGGTSLCSGAATTKYSTGTGYDEATGLGSIDFANLLAAWPANCQSCSSKASSRVTLSASSNAPAVGVSDPITITVAPASVSTSSPTGSLTILVDGSSATAPTLANGTATYNFSSTAAGPHTISVGYLGDSNFAPSSGTIVVGNQAFRVMATNVTVTAGNSASSTVTITPQEGYTGTISWSIASSTSISNACASIANTAVSGNSPVTATLSIQTTASACSSGSLSMPDSPVNRIQTASSDAPRRQHTSTPRLFGMATGLLFAGVLISIPLTGRKLWTVLGIFLLAVIAVTSVGCGTSPVPVSSNGSGNAAGGTYTLQLTGTDTSNASIGGAATLTLTIN